MSYFLVIGKYQYLVDESILFLCADNQRWNWQLYIDSVLIVVSLLYITMAVYTIWYLYDNWGHRLSWIELILYIW